jgi:hypothetical protein
MIWNVFLTGVLLSSMPSASAAVLDDGETVQAPVRRPAPLVAPDVGTVIFGGLPPIRVGPVR